MKERSICFSVYDVRAVLADVMTQILRPITPQPDVFTTTGKEPDVWPLDESERRILCPHGVPGDLLWVQEIWGFPSSYKQSSNLDANAVAYGADCCKKYNGLKSAWTGVRWRPPVYMQRWASRITLEITNVWAKRAERDYPNENIEKDQWVWVIEFKKIKP